MDLSQLQVDINALITALTSKNYGAVIVGVLTIGYFWLRHRPKSDGTAELVKLLTAPSLTPEQHVILEATVIRHAGK